MLGQLICGLEIQIATTQGIRTPRSRDLLAQGTQTQVAKKIVERQSYFPRFWIHRFQMKWLSVAAYVIANNRAVMFDQLMCEKKFATWRLEEFSVEFPVAVHFEDCGEVINC